VDTFQAFVLGLVQGLTEFLPISSSGHLAIVPWLFNWDTPGLAFDASLHLGTLVAVIVYFRTDLWRMIRAIPVASRNWRPLLAGKQLDHPQATDARLGILITIGCIPGGVAGILGGDRIDAFFHNDEHQDRAMIVIAILLAAFALVLLFAERVSQRNRSLSELNLTDALVIGAAQAIALLPGTSRSGVTLTAGLFRNINRADAARFSFLLGLPLILGAGLTGLSDLISNPESVGLGPIVVGMVTAGVSGLMAISGLIRFLQRAPTTVFTVYRLVAAAGIILLIATGVR
jgi:undecaprenyl-diphosphatase